VLAAAGAEGPAGPEGDGDAGATGDHLRIVLDERARAGLADEVRARLPNAVEVVLAAREAEADGPRRTADADRLRRTPHDLFVEYLATRDVDDERLVALFDELVDELASTPGEVAP